MRIASLLLLLWSLSITSAQAEDANDVQTNIPTTLAEAHAALERIFPADELAKIDAMPSEEGMMEYYSPLGVNLYIDWGIEEPGSLLAKHLRELGFDPPTQCVILDTFWCRRHGEDLRLKERTVGYAESLRTMGREMDIWGAEEMAKRSREGKAVIQGMMMPLQFEKRSVPVVQIPVKNGLSVSSMCLLRGGLFVTHLSYHLDGPRGDRIPEWYYAHSPGDWLGREPQGYRYLAARGYCHELEAPEAATLKPGRAFYSPIFFLDPMDHKMRKIRPREIDVVYGGAVVGQTAWVTGVTNGRPILVGLDGDNRVTVPLPQTDEIPDLGRDGHALLAVYSKAIYRLDDGQWTTIYAGDLTLPRTGPPAQQHGNMVFFQGADESRDESPLWWLTTGNLPRLNLLTRDTGLFVELVSWVHPLSPGHEMCGWGQPWHWENTSSYCVTHSGDLWACLGEGEFLLHRSPDGRYEFAVAYGAIQRVGDAPGSAASDQDIHVSAVTALPDDTLVLAGKKGLYRLKGNELVQELAFALPESSVVKEPWLPHPSFFPTNVLAADDESYFIANGHGGGIYLIQKDDAGQWTATAVESAPPTVW